MFIETGPRLRRGPPHHNQQTGFELSKYLDETRDLSRNTLSLLWPPILFDFQSVPLELFAPNDTQCQFSYTSDYHLFDSA
jgi:hypothetical protein